MTIPVSYQADWDLFLDWCTHAGAAAHPAQPLHQFFQEIPVASASTRTRRLAAIRAGLAERGYLPERPARAEAVSTVRIGPEWASIPESLAQLPVLRYPSGVRGRRDGWILVTVGYLRLTRRQARSITQEQVQVAPRLEIGGRPIEKLDPAAGCPACAVTRWLRILGPGGIQRLRALELMNPFETDLSVHDCENPLDDDWRALATLMPSLDTHGAIGSLHDSLSPLAISAIMRQRQAFTGFREQLSVRKEHVGRFANATSQELAEAFDEVDDQLSQLLARTAAILAEGHGLRHT